MKNLLNFQLAFSDQPPDYKGESPLVSWVKLLPEGEEILYGDERIVFTREYLQTLVSQTMALTEHFDKVANGEAYRMPIWRDHKRSHDRDGSVLAVRLAARDGFTGVWAQLERTPDTQREIDAGRVRYVSAGIAEKYVTQDGTEFGPVIREVSLTSDPFLKNIGTIQDTYEVTLSQKTISLAEDIRMDVYEETLEALKKGVKIPEVVRDVQALMEKVQRLQKENAKKGENLATEDEDEEMDKLGQFRQRVGTALSEAEDLEGAIEAVEAVVESLKEEVEEVLEEAMDKVEEVVAEATEEDLEKVLSKALAPIMMKLNALEKQPGRNLNLAERGFQGRDPLPREFSTYSEKIEYIMKTRKLGRSDAIKFEMTHKI